MDIEVSGELIKCDFCGNIKTSIQDILDSKAGTKTVGLVCPTCGLWWIKRVELKENELIEVSIEEYKSRFNI